MVAGLVAVAVLAGGLAVEWVHGRLRLPVPGPVALAGVYGLAALAAFALAAAARRHRRDHPDAFRGEGPGLHVAAGAWAGGALASPVFALLFLENAAIREAFLPLLVLHALTVPFSLAYLSPPLVSVLSLAGMLAGGALGWNAWRRRRGADAPRPARASRVLALLTATGVSTAVFVVLVYAGLPTPLRWDEVRWALVGFVALLVGAVAGLCWLGRASRRAPGRRERVLAGGLLGGVLGHCAASWLVVAVSRDVGVSLLVAPLIAFLSLARMTEATLPLLGLAFVALGAWLGARRGARADP